MKHCDCHYYQHTLANMITIRVCSVHLLPSGRLIILPVLASIHGAWGWKPGVSWLWHVLLVVRLTLLVCPKLLEPQSTVLSLTTINLKPEAMQRRRSWPSHGHEGKAQSQIAPWQQALHRQTIKACSLFKHISRTAPVEESDIHPIMI